MKNKSIRLAQAMMILKNLSINQISTATGIQIENLNAWFAGSLKALSPQSYMSLMSFLGLLKASLSSEYVHIWKLDAKPKLSSLQLSSLTDISGAMMGGAQMIEIKSDNKDSFFSKTRVYAFRGETFKVLLYLTGGIIRPKALDADSFPGVIWRSSSEGRPPCCVVDDLYWSAIKDEALTPSEFDDIFTETYHKCTWNDVRLIARERGITPTDISSWMLRNEESLDYFNTLSDTIVQRVEPTVELTIENEPLMIDTPHVFSETYEEVMESEVVELSTMQNDNVIDISSATIKRKASKPDDIPDLSSIKITDVAIEPPKTTRGRSKKL